MIEGVLHINGTPVKRERVEDFVDIDEGGPCERACVSGARRCRTA